MMSVDYQWIETRVLDQMPGAEKAASQSDNKGKETE